jgi:V/A-type H+-transporting ATPase subunit I
MTLRPQACRWFELIATRDELAEVLQALAHTGAVELQTHAPRAAPWVAADLPRQLERFHALARQHRSHWPAPAARDAVPVADPAALLAQRLEQLEAWRAQAEPLIAERERLDAEARALADLARVLQADPSLLPAPALLAAAGRFAVEARLYAGLPRPAASELPAELLQLTLPADGEHFALVVGPRALMAPLDEHFAALHGRRVAWPEDLGGAAPEAAAEVAARQQRLATRQAALADKLQALGEAHALPTALADIDLVAWLVQHGSELPAGDRLVWVTGWTTSVSEEAFCAPLGRQGLRCVAQFPEPPDGAEPPSLLANPPWVRSFEAFARMLGQPGRSEADPSPVLAVVAPLLFGFMFGDVGQGAVLCAAGWLLRKRVPMLQMLVPGGLMAMVFGVLFGSVFAREDLIPALWLHPLAEPVTLLAAAVGLGAALLLGGLALNALQAVWRRDARGWWARDAAVLLAYAGALAAPWQPQALWLLAVGALWLALGTAAQSTGRRVAGFVQGAAHFVEQALQLAVNTVSFARVGAFALAHAGLSAAVVGVAEAAGTVGYAVVLVLGNALILLLEGLVVGIQTTRLLLFEFFLRFLKGSGRAFRPLPPPVAHPPPTPRSAP